MTLGSFGLAASSRRRVLVGVTGLTAVGALCASLHALGAGGKSPPVTRVGEGIEKQVSATSSAMLQQSLIRGATLNLYPGAPHRLALIGRTRFYADLPVFVRA